MKEPPQPPPALRALRPLLAAGKGKWARYVYYNCPGCRRINVPQQQFEARFVELLDRLRPRPEVLRLLSVAVLERRSEEQKGVVERRRAIAQRLAADSRTNRQEILTIGQRPGRRRRVPSLQTSIRRRDE